MKKGGGDFSREGDYTYKDPKYETAGFTGGTETSPVRLKQVSQDQDGGLTLEKGEAILQGWVKRVVRTGHNLKATGSQIRIFLEEATQSDLHFHRMTLGTL